MVVEHFGISDDCLGHWLDCLLRTDLHRAAWNISSTRKRVTADSYCWRRGRSAWVAVAQRYATLGECHSQRCRSYNAVVSVSEWGQWCPAQRKVAVVAKAEVGLSFATACGDRSFCLG